MQGKHNNYNGASKDGAAFDPFAPQTTAPGAAQGSTEVMDALTPQQISTYNAQQPTQDEEKKKRKKPVFLRIMQVFFLVVFIACLAVLSFIAAQYIIQRMSNEDLANRVVLYDESANGGDLAKMTIDWDALYEECPDVVAWIRVPDTIINYPIVQGPDNNYYLHRSYDGSATWASTGGTIFLDSSNHSDFSDLNNVLYGHHMNDGSMFAEIAKWENQDEFDAHRTIYVLTPTMNYRLTTFSDVITTGSDAIIQTEFSTAEDFKEYVQDKMDRSAVDAGDFVHDWDGVVETMPTASKVGKMFMLVTCEYSQYDGRSCACAYVSEQAAPLSR